MPPCCVTLTKVWNKLSVTFLLFFVACGLFPTRAFSAQGAEEFQVTAVEVEGNKVVSSATILSKIKTRPGDRITQGTVDGDIKRLYGTGFFTDVSANVRPYQDGNLVRFVVKERPLVAGVVVTGSRHFRESKLREELKTKEQELLDRRRLKEDVEHIKQLYREKGFHLADVRSDVKVDEATNKATISFMIDEGRKVRVRKILFEGNQSVPARRLRRAMGTKQAFLFGSGYYRPEVLQEDVERLKELYRLEGYSDVQAAYETQFDEKKEWLAITMKIEEGPRYLVGAVDFRGVQQLGEEELRKRLKLVAGEPFSQERISQDAANLQAAYFAKGYMSASVEPSTRLNLENQKVDITYQVVEGSIAKVGDIVIQGNIKTKDLVIRRELRITPGERFDGEKLRRSKERLYNLGYFEEVTLETSPSSRPGYRNLVVTVKESKTGEFSFGGGFSSLDKFVGFAEIVQKNFDILNWPTFVGGGQEIKFSVQAGTRRRNFEISFTEPWIFNRPYLAGFDLFSSTRTKGEGYSFDLTRRGGDLRLGHRMGDYNRADLMYRLENVQVSDVPNTASSALRDEVGRNTVSSVRLGFTRDTRDNIFNPKQGYRASSDIETAGSFLGGEKDFWKWTADGSVFFTPILQDQVLELHAMAGLANNFGNSASVPIFERFFAGGADTIRGYRERRVGPKDSVNKDPIGGEAMALFNVEYTVPFLDFLKGAVFFDTGNVWNQVDEFAKKGFKLGTGAGVRIKTPFGPVKLDYGFPLNPDRGEHKTGRIHFSASRAF